MTTSLVYGGIELIGGNYDVYPDLQWGAPDPQIEVLARPLLDGETLAGARSSNREIVLRVDVRGKDFAALARNEAALVKQVELTRNELRWTPQAGAPVTIFDTFRGRLVYSHDEYQDAVLLRSYTLTLPALPFPRSDREVVDYLREPGATTQLDAMTSATGWTAYGAPLPQGTSEPAAVSVSTAAGTFYEGTSSLAATDPQVGTYSPGSPGWTGYTTDLYIKRTGTYSLGTDTYLTIMVRAPWVTPGSAVYGWLYYTPAGGAQTGPVAPYSREWVRTGGGADGWIKMTWSVPGGGTIQDPAFWFSTSAAYPAGTSPAAATWYVDDLRRAATSGTTLKQFANAVDVAGSERTGGTVRLQHASAALGDALVYTYADHGNGYRPQTLQFTTGGAPNLTAAAATLSGQRTNLTTPTIDIPLSLLEDGPYLVMVHAYPGATTTAQVTATFATRLAGVDQTPTVVATSASTAFTSGTPVLLSLGVVNLPPLMGAAQTNGFLRATITGIPTGGGVGELLLFRLDDAQLTWVACGTAAPTAGGTARYLNIETPSLELPFGAVTYGAQADGTDLRAPGANLKLLGRHEFRPGGTNIYVGTTNAADVLAYLVHTPRFHSTVGEAVDSAPGYSGDLVKQARALTGSGATGTATVTNTAPTPGNLLAVAVSTRQNGGAPVFPAGWTVELAVWGSSTPVVNSMYVGWKVADGSETSVTVTWPSTTFPNQGTIWMGEFKRDAAAPAGGTWTRVAAAAGPETTSGGGVATTPSLAPTDRKVLALALYSVESCAYVVAEQVSSGYTLVHSAADVPGGTSTTSGLAVAAADLEAGVLPACTYTPTYSPASNGRNVPAMLNFSYIPPA